MSKIYRALKKVEKEKEAEKIITPIVPGDTAFAEYDQYLVTLLTPNSVAAEQFRKLKTSIIETEGSNDKRCILITSSVSGEGKTLTASNLAISIAQEIQQYVLLIDADLRRPGLYKYFGVPSSPGLSEYLNENIDLSQLLVKTPVPKLSILPAGKPTNKAAELFASQKMRNLVREIKSRYDDRYIIIDSTPVMSTTESDILSQQADKIVFVVKAGKTPREVVKRSLFHLEKNKDKIIGIVFNNADIEASRYSYSYYQYYDYYGESKK
jgi:receptor protein-tyrosine kinase/non-specific protein-tyrosine kinase